MKTIARLRFIQMVLLIVLVAQTLGCDDDSEAAEPTRDRTPAQQTEDTDPPPEPIRFEAEDGELDGTAVSTGHKGYSGTGYVTGFGEEEGTLTIAVETEPGIYALSIGFATPNGTKGFEVYVNDVSSTGQFPDVGNDYAVYEAGLFEFEAGENTVLIGYGWGYYDIDYIEIVATEPTPPEQPEKILTDPEPIDESRALMSFLVDNYGEHVLAGQQTLDDIAYVESMTRRTPAVGVFDFIDYSPSRVENGADPTGSSESWIDWSDQGGGIVSMMWHWNAPADLIDTEDNPWWRGFYTDATTFDIEAVLADPDGERYALILRDMDAIAAELQKFEDALLPVLWRPLHEASGEWFWWGAKGPEPFIELWRLMWDRLVHHHGLHNLIWVYTVGDEDWYPGDEYVDIVGCDVYADETASMTGQWEETKARHDGVKLIALTESAHPPIPDYSRDLEIWWSWFAVWSGQFIRSVEPDTLGAIYDDPDVITLDELPAWWLYPFNR